MGFLRALLVTDIAYFFSAFWKELFKMVGIKLIPSTIYHPQTDVQTERVNLWLEGHLTNYVSGQQKTWIKWLHLGELCYILVFICPLACLLSNKFMVMMHKILLSTYLVIVDIQKLRIGLNNVNIFWRFWNISCRLPKTNKNNMHINIEWRKNYKWITWCIWDSIPTNKNP